MLPVFDTKDIADFLARDGVIPYLPDMLSSFARIETVTLAFPDKRGIWRRLRFDTMDIDSLIGFSCIIEEEAGFPFYKRIEGTVRGFREPVRCVALVIDAALWRRQIIPRECGMFLFAYMSAG